MERPVVGELFTTRAVTRPFASASGKYCSPVRISPELSTQFSTKVAWRPRTASPSTRNMESRQRLLPPRSKRQTSATPAPPMKPTRPSTISSTRWVRLLIRGSVCQRSG